MYYRLPTVLCCPISLLGSGSETTKALCLMCGSLYLIRTALLRYSGRQVQKVRSAEVEQKRLEAQQEEWIREVAALTVQLAWRRYHRWTKQTTSLFVWRYQVFSSLQQGHWQKEKKTKHLNWLTTDVYPPTPHVKYVVLSHSIWKARFDCDPFREHFNTSWHQRC